MPGSKIYDEQIEGYMLHHKMAYNKERGEWIGIIFQIEYGEDDIILLNVGAERTYDAMLAWCKAAMTDPNAPDMYDRRS